MKPVKSSVSEAERMPPSAGANVTGRTVLRRFGGRIGLLLGSVMMSLQALAASQDVSADPSLYQCKVIVTGTDMRSRPGGLERCVRDVLVKVAADPALADDPRVLALGTRASGMVEDFFYLDRMTDIRTHDEQGTRDRPFDLIAHADPGKIADLLRELDRTPWLRGRPVLLAVVQVRRAGADFPVTADGSAGERQRQALLAAGETYGMRISLPTVEQLGNVDRSRPDLGGLAIAAHDGGVALLRGSMTWSDADFGWNFDWHLGGSGDPVTWEIRGVSFDEGFRAGVARAATELSARSR